VTDPYPLRAVPDKTVGSMLRARRFEDGLTQAALAKEFGVRQQTIAAWERGERPQTRYHAALADFLGLPDESSLIDLLNREAVLASTGLTAATENVDPMVALARSFAERLRLGTLTPDEAAIYRDFIAYFARERTTDSP
jgi:transcriptional regulator with XRE-family HTH domain